MRLKSLAISMALLCCMPLKTVAAVEQEELIRASILEKIAHFIEWPALDTDRFTICAFDNAPLLPALEMYYVDSQFNNKPIRIVLLDHFKALLECQIIYIGHSETRHLENIQQITEGHPVLLVAEKKNTISQGAHVDFFIEDSRLNLEVNRTALIKNHLNASYHLLRVARVVE